MNQRRTQRARKPAANIREQEVRCLQPAPPFPSFSAAFRSIRPRETRGGCRFASIQPAAHSVEFPFAAPRCRGAPEAQPGNSPPPPRMRIADRTIGTAFRHGRILSQARSTSAPTRCSTEPALQRFAGVERRRGTARLLNCPCERRPGMTEVTHIEPTTSAGSRALLDRLVEQGA